MLRKDWPPTLPSIDTGRSTGGNLSLTQGGAADYSSHLPVSVAMSSGEAEYM